MKLRRRQAGFTLTEMMISTTLAGVLGGIIYLVASESLTSYARNVSINRSYTDARIALDRISEMVASAGHTPVLLDTNGAPTTATPTSGIRFYRANAQSTYKVTSGITGPTSSNKTITIALATGQPAPLVKDVVTVATLGYQGVISSLSTSGTVCTLTMVNTLATDSSPTPTAAVDFTNPQQWLQSYRQVEYVVVGNQLRYYPQSLNVANDTAAVFNNPANYLVLVNLVSTAFGSNGAAATPLLPFSIVNSPTVMVQLYAQNPDYSNRSTASTDNVSSTNFYTFMQCSLGARSPVLLRGPY